ncbi:RanBD1 domain-containing protein [Mycena sanguinolenta]|uniref:RanBD1 domain-containing protein n=1 Tax=Mycena sanguinolenta TaxID=230812 RepID=A0A8H6Z1J5_9AGAR|nr:RanBD1 domain-containing protein [Mycena sanguinolenta]
MLPVADSLNFVVCGFATLAATVGYAYARKTRPLPSRGVPQPHNWAMTSPVLAKHNSLKRKRNHEQEEALTDPEMGYPHNLSSIYPNKRRSDSVSDEDSTKDTKEMNVEPSNATVPPPTTEPASSESNGIEGGSNPEASKLDEPVLPEEPKPAVIKSPEPPKIFDRSTALCISNRISQNPSTHHTLYFHPYNISGIRNFRRIVIAVFQQQLGRWEADLGKPGCG